MNGIEKQACNDAKLNRPDPPDDLLDSFLYLALYSLYGTFFQGQLSRDQAHKIKADILKLYQERKKQYDLDRRIVEDCRQRTKNTELARHNYGTCRTIQNANKLWEALK